MQFKIRMLTPEKKERNKKQSKCEVGWCLEKPAEHGTNKFCKIHLHAKNNFDANKSKRKSRIKQKFSGQALTAQLKLIDLEFHRKLTLMYARASLDNIPNDITGIIGGFLFGSTRSIAALRASCFGLRYNELLADMQSRSAKADTEDRTALIARNI